MELDAAIRLVNMALSREYNSVEGYILHSSPWVMPGEEPALAALQEIKTAHALTAAWMTERLRLDLGAGPTVRAFEYWKLDLNYLSLPYLLEFALDHNRRVHAEYEATLKEVAGDAALEAIFRRLADEAKANAAKLEKVVAASAPAAAKAAAAAAPKPAGPAAARPASAAAGAAAPPSAAPAAAAGKPAGKPAAPAPAKPASGAAGAETAAGKPAPPPPPPPA